MSMTISSSSNWAVLASRLASLPTTIVSPSKTKSSWPPVMLTYATGAPISLARFCTRASRTSSLFLSKGEPLGTTNKPGVLALIESSECQISSQIATATSTPWIRTTRDSSPATKFLNSSKTP